MPVFLVAVVVVVDTEDVAAVLEVVSAVVGAHRAVVAVVGIGFVDSVAAGNCVVA